MPFATVDNSPIRHSKASSRYDSGGVIRKDAYDRTWVLLQWVGTGKRVLEVGCSTGYMSRHLMQRNCCVTGIEVDADAAEKARPYCSEVLIRDLNAPDWMAGVSGKAFDVVLLGDVLEHLVDPSALLMQIGTLLDEEGSVVISLPNVVHWITRLRILLGQFNYMPAGTLDHTHLRFFTVKTARKLIEGSGFRIVRFRPAIGGRMSGHARPIWHCLALLLPGLFAFQLLFQARK